jgi:ribosomal protein L11 methyltransferase
LFAISFGVPYRIDITRPPHDAFDQLVQMGALDIEPVNGGLAAIIPDGLLPEAVAGAMGVAGLAVSPAVGRDNGSVWLLSPRSIHIGGIFIAPLEVPAPPEALRLTDSAVFGTGHHPSSGLCVEALQEALSIAMPESVLDVGTGSGLLALAALKMGVPRAVGVDIDADALNVAAEHARLNNLSDRLQFVRGGPEAVAGAWPLVVANILAAPLIEMAPILVRRVRSRGRVILCGIACSLEQEVLRTYQRFGMRHVRSKTRAGWTLLVVEASW